MSTRQTPYFADGYKRLGRLRRRRREYRKAIILLRKELAIRTGHKHQVPKDYYECKLRLADVYDDVSEYKEVLDIIEGDANDYKNLFGPNSYEAETSLTLLGTANRMVGSDLKARDYFRDAVRIAENNSTDTSHRARWVYLELGWVLTSLQEYDEAVIWLNRAIHTSKIYQPGIDSNHDLVTAHGYLELAEISLIRKQFDEAHKNASKSIEYFTRLTKHTRWLVRSIIVKSKIYEALNDSGKAKEFLLKHLQDYYNANEGNQENRDKLTKRLGEVLRSRIKNNQKVSIEEREVLLDDVRILAIVQSNPSEGIKTLLDHKKFFPIGDKYEEVKLALEHDYNIANFYRVYGRDDLAIKYLENLYKRLCETKGLEHPATRFYDKMIKSIKNEISSKKNENEEEDDAD